MSKEDKLTYYTFIFGFVVGFLICMSSIGQAFMRLIGIIN